MYSPLRFSARALLSLLACISSLPAGRAEVRLPHVFGGHMVLQRDKPITVWGWADAGEAISVRLGDATQKTEADAGGAWRITLPPMPAGGPHELTVSGKSSLTLTDVLVGEVWLCSGQSNMEWSVPQAKNGAEEVAAANFPRIRLFHVPRRAVGQPLPDVDAEWLVCSPEAIARDGGFSAVGYFFGREIHRELGVPVGLVEAAWGGTRIEPWTPAAAFVAQPALQPIVEDIRRASDQYRENVAESLYSIEAWTRAARAALNSGGDPPVCDWPPHPLADAGRPTSLYNGMIHALAPMSIRGAIWYQGESNLPDGMLYFDKMKALIGGWRQVWGQGDFPFYYVQLAPYRYGQNAPGAGPQQLAELWEAQSAALTIPNTGMAATTDVTDLADIHPRDKQTVGRRLALLALAMTYGQTNLVYSGPLYKSASAEGAGIRVRFEHVGGGLISRDGKPLTWFEVAGADRKFVSANAVIDGDSVVVSSDAVREPLAVRFGWSMEATPNLMNKEGLPASPFRTERW